MPLPLRTPPAADAAVSAWATYANTVIADIAEARITATTPEEHGQYEAARQAALVITEDAARLALARLQLAKALDQLATAAAAQPPAIPPVL